MPSLLLERINPLIRTAIEGMAGVPVYWKDQPGMYAGPSMYVNPTVGGIQATLKLKEFPTREGFNQTKVRASTEYPSGFEFYDEGTTEVIATLEVWSWSQADNEHSHNITHKISARLEQLDNTFRQALVAQNIVPIETLAIITLDEKLDKRITPISIADLRFRCSPEELPREGFIIETAGMEGDYRYGNTPIVQSGTVVPAFTGWKPEKASRVIGLWDGRDSLESGNVWRDRIRGLRLRPRGTDPSDVEDGFNYVRTGLESYFETDTMPATTSRWQYVWCYAAMRGFESSMFAAILAMFFESPGPWFIGSSLDGSDMRARVRAGSPSLQTAFFGSPTLDRKVHLGALIKPESVRLDVDGTAGPTVAITADLRARSRLHVGGYGGISSGAGEYRSDSEIYSIGIVEDQDVRSESFGYVKQTFKGD